MGWVAHTQGNHDLRRRMELYAIRDALYREIAKRFDHAITVRFTPDSVWTECKCGWDSNNEDSRFSSSVQLSGNAHLTRIGEMGARMALRERTRLRNAMGWC